MRAPPLGLAGCGIGALIALASRGAAAEALVLRLDHRLPGQAQAVRVSDWREPPPVELPLVLRRDSRLAGDPVFSRGPLPGADQDERLPGDPSRERPPYAPPEPGPRDAGEAEPAMATVRWRLAPIRWRGVLSTDLRSFSADGQPRRFQQIETANLYGATYIYQPWFAQLNVGLTGLMAKDRGQNAGRSTSLGGNGLLNVFPTSRYPFQARFERSDNRSSDAFTGQQYTTQRYGLRQSYRTATGHQSSSASFDRSTLTSSATGRDTVQILGATHAWRIDLKNSVDGEAGRTTNVRDSTGEKSVFDRAHARHRFTGDGLLNIETLASYGGSVQDNGVGGAVAFRNNVLQLNSFGTWRPDDESPLSVSGGARIFQSEFESNGTQSQSRSMMANAAATYRVNQNLMVNGGGSVIQNSGTTAAGLVTSQFAGATYTPDLRRFGEFNYTTSFAASVNNQTGGESGGRHVLSGQATHALQRSYELSPSQALAMNVSQSISGSQDSVSGGLRTLAHYGGLSYRMQPSNTLSGYASASASDSRTSGYASNSFQMLNLQLSGQGTFGRYSSVGANYTVQGVRQGAESAGGFNVSGNGGVTYQHARAFNVPRLRYYASYQRNDYQLNTRQQGDLNAPLERVDSSLEQRLDYRVGRIDARLSYRIADIDGKKNALLFFRLVREFGD